MRLYDIRKSVLQGRHWFIRITAPLASGLCLAAFIAITASGTGVIMRVSTDAAGNQGDSFSQRASISSDGRYVAFESTANNLVPGDVNQGCVNYLTTNCSDIFVKDTRTGTIAMVSTDSDGNQGNSDSNRASISGDGRYVAFESAADNLVSGDSNGATDVFVKDTRTGDTELVSVSTGGVSGNGPSGSPSISFDGRYIAFSSSASDLAGSDTNGRGDIFIRDVRAETTRLVSLLANGTQGNGHSYQPSISADGRFVAFTSQATNLTAGDTNGCLIYYSFSCPDVFLKDIKSNTIMMIDTNPSGHQGNDWSQNPAISGNGRYVAFESIATDLVDGVTSGGVIRKDTLTGATALISADATGNPGTLTAGSPAISADGRFVAFNASSELVPGALYGGIYVKDASTGAIDFVSQSATGYHEDNRLSYYPRISADGRYIAFESESSYLVPGDTGYIGDIFLSVNTLAGGIQLPGRMTGDGKLTSGSVSATHSLNINCEAGKGTNNFQVTWGRNKFSLTGVTSAACSDIPGTGANPPKAGFDTLRGSGTGRLNGAPGATVEYAFTDNERVGKDTGRIIIKNASGNVVLDVGGNLNKGDYEARKR